MLNQIADILLQRVEMDVSIRQSIQDRVSMRHALQRILQFKFK